MRFGITLYKYLLIGSVGFGVDSGITVSLVALFSVDPVSARALAILIALTVTWYGHRTFTFKTADKDFFFEWCRFLGVNLIGGLSNYATYCLVIFLIQGISIVAAVAIGSAVGLVVNLVGARYFAFRPRTKMPSES